MSNQDAAADTVYHALVDAGFRPRSYSGRGMYGKRCVAISLQRDVDLLKVGAAIGQGFASLPVATDGLGRGLVVYWPHAEWQDDYESEDPSDPLHEG